jgi:uncharacterized membrane protein
MVLMALDHVRGSFSEVSFGPTDLTQTTTALFFTRWVTHFCAPVFVFLAGTGAYLSASRGKTKGALSWFLVTRGLWLVILDPTVISFGWSFNLNFGRIGVNVIWAIGWSMIALAGLIHLPRWAITTFGLTMIAGHNLFDGVHSENLGSVGWLWTILHTGGTMQPFAGRFAVGYPLIPWIGVMAAGYAFGGMLQGDVVQRRRRLLTLGLAMTVLFVVLRAINIYGDPRPWSSQKNAMFTFLSFLNCEKYPPSLMFLSMTLGPAIAAMAIFDRPLGAVGRVLTVYGRVPLFYYVLHIYFIALLAMVAPFATLYRPDPENIDSFNPGYPLPVVYLVWAGVVLTLYFPCRWYMGVKQRRRDWWLSYL